MLAPTKALDEANEGLRVYGLMYYGYGAGFLRLQRNVGTSGHDHDRNIGQERNGGSLGEKPPAIEHRHHQVQKNQLRASLRTVNQSKRFKSIRCTQDILAPERQNIREQFAGFTIILDDQNHWNVSPENLTPQA
jgi:hypothetical protein